MIKSIMGHRKEKHHSEQQFKVFQRILKEHCESVTVKEDNIIEVYDLNGEIIAEIDYFAKVVLSTNEQIQSHLTDLLEIHHHSCVAMDC